MALARSDNPNYLWWLVLVAAAGWLIWLLGPILTPFLLAATLAYICHPLVDALSRRRVPRTLAVVLVGLLLVAIFIMLLLVMLPLLAKQVRAIADLLPGYVDWIRTTAAPLADRYLNVELDVGLVRDWVIAHLQDIRGIAARLLPTITTGGLALLAFLVNLVLVPVVLFYFLRDWPAMVRHVDTIIPRRWHAKSVEIAREIDEVLGQFLRGQLLVMLLMGAFYTIALWFVGLEFALSVGLISGLVTFVPYLGVITGVTLATLTGLLQFGAGYGLLWVWAVFFAGQLVEGYLLVPKLVGDRIGLHPVAVIFALLAFGQLFGFLGVLLALPVSAALFVWLRHLRASYFESGVYNEKA